MRFFIWVTVGAMTEELLIGKGGYDKMDENGLNLIF
jgi:hypothetical protein